MFDNGEVLQGLEETWTFMGANVMEWSSGAVVFMIVGSLGVSPARAMPFMVIAGVATATTLASLRKSMPDEHRGIRNLVATSVGIDPPGIPPPSALQPIWSGTPLREIPANSHYRKLGFDKLFPVFRRDLSPAPELEDLREG